MRGVREHNFNPIQIYPINELSGKESDFYNAPEEAVIQARIIDNSKTVKEFEKRFELILSQMDKRNAPKEQYEQIKKIEERWKKLRDEEES